VQQKLSTCLPFTKFGKFTYYLPFLNFEKSIINQEVQNIKMKKMGIFYSANPEYACSPT
jgi:hypothetical protein